MTITNSRDITSVDPRTGDIAEHLGAPTTPQELGEIIARAQKASPTLERLGRSGRARFLRAIASQLEARRDQIIDIGVRETALGAARLGGELTRTTYQAEFFAQVLDEGSYLEATIDHAGDTPMGHGPDLRRMLVPIGPVAVFGASNFPLAFSVPGGDTISALAAGNPVIVKAHRSHPSLSRLCAAALEAAVTEVGAPEGTIGIVYGTQAGAALVAHPGIKAVGFTGSLTGGRALLDVIDNREEPIPFYGELASLNPLIVTTAAAHRRASEIATGFVGSITASGGQLCTKPGVLFAPVGYGGDELVRCITERLAEQVPVVLLNERITESYAEITQALTDDPGTTELAATADPEAGGVLPKVYVIDASDFTDAHAEECFGPSAVVVRYEQAELESALSKLPASLTLSLFGEQDEIEKLTLLQDALRDRAGRILYDQFPTGVLVSWAQHHGGPWPATNTLHTSVGATAIRRFLRPMTWQNAPQQLLPSELQEVTETPIPRRVDGRLLLQ